jgi:hypothetical protein
LTELNAEIGNVKQLRSFGLVVGGIFLAIGLWPLLIGRDLRTWAAGLAVLLIVPGLVAPRTLRPAFRIWMKLAMVLGWINTRIILSLIFFLVLTPTALVLRIIGRKLMALEFDPAAATYRVARKARPSSHMKFQF